MIEGLIVNLDDPRQKRDLLANLASATGTVVVTVKPYSDRRSLRANAYWWSVIVTAFVKYNAAQNVKMTPEQAHTALKLDILPMKVLISPVTGRTITVPADTHTMSREKFADLIEAGHAYMADLGVPLPDPHTFGGIHASDKRRRSA